jgi:hypothetical protein
MSWVTREHTSKVKTPPICTKVPPINRARQGESDHTNPKALSPIRPYKNASENFKTRHFTKLSTNKGEPLGADTRYAV